MTTKLHRKAPIWLLTLIFTYVAILVALTIINQVGAVKYGLHDKMAHLALKHDIESYNPTIVLMQDAQGVLDGSLGDYFRTWNVRSYGQFVIASRLPLGLFRNY